MHSPGSARTNALVWAFSTRKTQPTTPSTTSLLGLNGPSSCLGMTGYYSIPTVVLQPLLIIRSSQPGQLNVTSASWSKLVTSCERSTALSPNHTALGSFTFATYRGSYGFRLDLRHAGHPDDSARVLCRVVRDHRHRAWTAPEICRSSNPY